MAAERRYSTPCLYEQRVGQPELAEGKVAAWPRALGSPEVVYDRIRDRERALPAGHPWMTTVEAGGEEEEGGAGEEEEEDEGGPEGYHCQICGYHADQLQPFNVHLHSAHPAVVLQELYGLLDLTGSPVHGLGPFEGPIPGLGPFRSAEPNQGLPGGSIPSQGRMQSYSPPGGSISGRGPPEGSISSHGLPGGSISSHGPPGGSISSHGQPGGSISSHGPPGGSIPIHGPVHGDSRKPDIVQIDLTGEDEAGEQGATSRGPARDPGLEPGAEGSLTEAFNHFPYPSPEEMAQCGQSAGLPAESVGVWFAVQRLRHGISWTPEEVREARLKLSGKPGTLRMTAPPLAPPAQADGRQVLAPAWRRGPGGGAAGLLPFLRPGSPRKAHTSPDGADSPPLAPGERRCTKAKAELAAPKGSFIRRRCQDEEEEARSLQARTGQASAWLSDSPCRPGGPDSQPCPAGPGEGCPGLDSEADPRRAAAAGPAPGRPRKTKEQLLVLKAFFLRSRWPSGADYTRLVERTGLARADVIQWFGDTRYALKNGQLKWVHRPPCSLGAQAGLVSPRPGEGEGEDGLASAACSAEWICQKGGWRKARRRRRKRKALAVGRGEDGVSGEEGEGREGSRERNQIVRETL
ncbi:collagen alpha-2(XI) chain-like [Stegostoma tigrinum]|uniref:collagen alpha-2(XI) chain-like n=1 Tax=Stegostoma tigrinum TaxID=3053191 RepID=UPI0028706B8C|nr:collagen alpha-2(XI) chain-like [Stegostoma tigrinum]